MKTIKNGGGVRSIRVFVLILGFRFNKLNTHTHIFNNITSHRHSSNRLNRLCEVMTVAEKNFSAIHRRWEDLGNSHGRDAVCFILRDEAVKNILLSLLRQLQSPNLDCEVAWTRFYVATQQQLVLASNGERSTAPSLSLIQISSPYTIKLPSPVALKSLSLVRSY